MDTQGQPAVHNDVTAPVDGAVVQSGSITGDVVVAVASDNATNVLYEAERLTALPTAAFAPVAETEAPPRLSNLPSRPGLFVGRGELLDRLDAALARPGTAVVHAVHGLGGIGKSTLAAYWAANHAATHNPIWWVSAHAPRHWTPVWRRWPRHCNRPCPASCPSRSSGNARSSGWPPTTAGSWSSTT